MTSERGGEKYFFHVSCGSYWTNYKGFNPSWCSNRYDIYLLYHCFLGKIRSFVVGLLYAVCCTMSSKIPNMSLSFCCCFMRKGRSKHNIILSSKQSRKTSGFFYTVMSRLYCKFICLYSFLYAFIPWHSSLSLCNIFLFCHVLDLLFLKETYLMYGMQYFGNMPTEQPLSELKLFIGPIQVG